MNLIMKIIDFILHIDVYLKDIITQYGAWTYGLLFFVIFMETGFVVTPVPAGRFLIFAAATFAAAGALNPWLIFIFMSIAAFAGDTANYWIGHAIGAKANTGEVKWIKKNTWNGPMHSSKTRRQDDFPGALCSHYPDVYTLCCRCKQNAIWIFHHLEPGRWGHLGGNLHAARLFLREYSLRSGKL